MLVTTLTKIVQTCSFCPSQWDAWDSEGYYWYLRYRWSNGTAERRVSPDPDAWTEIEPDIEFNTGRRDGFDGEISLEEFCALAGLTIHPEAEIS